MRPDLQREFHSPGETAKRRLRQVLRKRKLPPSRQHTDAQCSATPFPHERHYETGWLRESSTLGDYEDTSSGNRNAWQRLSEGPASPIHVVSSLSIAGGHGIRSDSIYLDRG